MDDQKKKKEQRNGSFFLFVRKLNREEKRGEGKKEEIPRERETCRVPQITSPDHLYPIRLDLVYMCVSHLLLWYISTIHLFPPHSLTL